MTELVEKSLYKLITYCEKEEYKGYDPYDVQNSFLPISKLPHFFLFAITQANKRSPLNFRPLLAIGKNYHTKAMGLFLSGYCNLFKITNDKRFFDKTNYFLNWLEHNSAKFCENICWGFDYDYASRKENIKKGFPTVVHHSYVLRALYEYWLLTGSKIIFEMIDKSKYFILNDVPINTYDEGICFGYHPRSVGCCYNASLHAAECLAIIDKINNKNDYFELIKKAVAYVVYRQKSTGVWYYSHGLNPEKENKQIDFHQGFILDCLRSINQLTGHKLASLINPALQAGLEFYYSKQFDEHGQSLFRYPKKYPTDIHNQAQGIITFSKFSDYDQRYKKMAESILIWTIQNMQDPKEYFHYQKYRYFTNKIPHIRWSQAWMFLAITEYLMMNKVNRNEKVA